MSRRQVSCGESNELREGLRPLSSITNWVGGEVINWELPPITATTWGVLDEIEILRDEFDEDGCRHYAIEADS